MLNDIRLHLDSNEETQIALEKEQADKLQQQFVANQAAFSQHIPTIAATIVNHLSSQYSIFVDRKGQINIIDIASGNTFYGFDVDEEITKQVDNWAAHSAIIDLQNLDSQKTVNPRQSFDEFVRYAKALENTKQTHLIDTLVIMGVGKGRHIHDLIEASDAQNIVIYEPNSELFYCSLYCTDWHQILAKAAIANKRIFLQLGMDASNFCEDLKELKSAFKVRHLWFFKHYNHKSFDSILNNLRHQEYYLLDRPLLVEEPSDFKDYLVPWTPSLDLSQWQSVCPNSLYLQENLSAFEHYFPSVYLQFKDYEYKHWQPIRHRLSGEVNLFHLRSATLLNAESARQNGQALAKHFQRYPNRDGLIFGYEQDKLKHYLHNVFVRRTATVLRAQNDEVGELPKDIKALIFFGIESGYTIESLIQTNTIDCLILCEPNADFFYASLFAISWADILQRVDEAEQRMYINIGEAGAHLFSDLNRQFVNIGPYILNDTYFLQGYQNKLLSRAIKDLRDQLKVTFTLGENLDHALYGIEHTAHALSNGLPVMAAKAPSLLPKSLLELPVFIVGNGPSLDDSIELVLENRQKIIVVSCGTALQALYRYGITPDFHAEVEQCRATFDWASRINAPEFLKSITLISVNGIHPDTCDLYKDSLLAFKSGESSSIVATDMLGESRFSYLKQSFPTVSNMAIDFFTTLGFNQIYLLGVDLGFVDYNNHHSKKSGYFEDGKAIYDYQKNLARSLPIRGNFRDKVFTKAEFNLSRTMMEQLLSAYQIDVFNLSDGAYIQGATPLTMDQVLIVNKDIDRDIMHQQLRQAFITITGDIRGMYAAAYSKSLLKEQLATLMTFTECELTSAEQINDLVVQQREFLNDALVKGESLFGYYFYGSLNYMCAALSKAAMANDEEQVVNNASKILNYWQRLLNDFSDIITNEGDILDSAAAFVQKREAIYLSRMPEVQDISLCIFSPQLKGYFAAFTDENIHITTSLSQTDKNSLVFISCSADAKAFMSSTAYLRSEQRILLMFHDIQQLTEDLVDFVQQQQNVCLCYVPIFPIDANLSRYVEGEHPISSANEILHFAKARLLDASRYKWIMFKPQFCETGLNRAKEVNQDEYTSKATQFIEQHLMSATDRGPTYSFKHYIGITAIQEYSPTITDCVGNRGMLIQRRLEPYELLGEWQGREATVEILQQLQEHKLSV
jgi:hypothetical protein